MPLAFTTLAMELRQYYALEIVTIYKFLLLQQDYIHSARTLSLKLQASTGAPLFGDFA